MSFKGKQLLPVLDPTERLPIGYSILSRVDEWDFQTEPKYWLPNLHLPLNVPFFLFLKQQQGIHLFEPWSPPSWPLSFPDLHLSILSLSSPTGDNNPSQQPVHWPHDQKPYWVTQQVRQCGSSSTLAETWGGWWVGGDGQGGATGVIHPCEVCHRGSAEVRRWPEAAARTYTGIFSIPKGCNDIKGLLTIFFPFFCSRSQK